MRKIFNSDELNASFLRDGYVVADLLSPDQIAMLQRLYDTEQFPPAGSFYLTIWQDSPAHRLMVYERVQEIISVAYHSVLHQYKPIVSSFAVKQPGAGSGWHPHQDDTFADEAQFVSLSIWAPLIDTDAMNGTLQVLPRSHCQYTGPRSPNIPQPFKNELDQIASRFIDIDIKAGQAIFFDHRLIHGSRPNSSTVERVAVVTILIPQEAELTYLYLDTATEPHMIKQYAISERYYLEAPLGEFSREPSADTFKLIATYPYSSSLYKSEHI